MRTSSKKTWLNVWRFSDVDERPRPAMPGVFMSSEEVARCPCASAPPGRCGRGGCTSRPCGRAKSRSSEPLITNVSPSATARVWSEARSEPARGSLKPWHQTVSALAMPGRMLRLLLVGAVEDDRRADAVGADAELDGGAVVGHLLVVDDLHHVRWRRGHRAPPASRASASPCPRASSGMREGTSQRAVAALAEAADCRRRCATSRREAPALRKARISARNASSCGEKRNSNATSP